MDILSSIEGLADLLAIARQGEVPVGEVDIAEHMNIASTDLELLARQV